MLSLTGATVGSTHCDFHFGDMEQQATQEHRLACDLLSYRLYNYTQNANYRYKKGTADKNKMQLVSLDG